MTRRRVLLWGSLASSVILSFVDPSFLPEFLSQSASTSMPIAAPVTRSRAHAPSTGAASQATAAVSPGTGAEVDTFAAERHELLRQVRAFVSGSGTSSGPGVGASAIVAPMPRENMLDADGTPAAQRLFVSQNWGPPPPAPSSAPVPTAPLPPTAPPMPFTFLGKAQAGGAWEVYLARGEKTFIVHENSVVDDVYRVASIKPPRLSLIYIPMNQQQELDIGAAQ